MICILGWPIIYMCAFLSRVDIRIPKSAAHSLFTWPGVKTHVYTITNVSQSVSLSLSLSLSHCSPNHTQIWVGFSSSQILQWWFMFVDSKSERREGQQKAEYDPTEPLRTEAKPCKDVLWKHCQDSNNNSAHGCL